MKPLNMLHSNYSFSNMVRYSQKKAMGLYSENVLTEQHGYETGTTF